MFSFAKAGWANLSVQITSVKSLTTSRDCNIMVTGTKPISTSTLDAFIKFPGSAVNLSLANGVSILSGFLVPQSTDPNLSYFGRSTTSIARPGKSPILIASSDFVLSFLEPPYDTIYHNFSVSSIKVGFNSTQVALSIFAASNLSALSLMHLPIACVNAAPL